MILARDEMPPAPDEEPAAVDSIAFAFDPPNPGWFEAQIILADRVEPLFVSDVFDPFPHMLSWLRLIARGEVACLSIDQEGDVMDIVAEPAEDERTVRVTAWAEELKANDFERRIAFDIRIPSMVLVAALYDGIHAVWEKPDPDTFWRQWYCSDNCNAPPGTLYVQYEMRDPEIEAFLGRYR